MSEPPPNRDEITEGELRALPALDAHAVEDDATVRCIVYRRRRRMAVADRQADGRWAVRGTRANPMEGVVLPAMPNHRVAAEVIDVVTAWWEQQRPDP
jgi:hypothetical protein